MADQTTLPEYPTDEMYKQTPLAVFCGFADVSQMLLAKYSQSTYRTNARAEMNAETSITVHLSKREDISYTEENANYLRSTATIEWYKRDDTGVEIGLWYPTSVFCNILKLKDHIDTMYPRDKVKHRRHEHLGFKGDADWDSAVSFNDRQIASLIECDSSFVVTYILQRLTNGKQPEATSCITNIQLGNPSKMVGKRGKANKLVNYTNSIHSCLFVITTKSGRKHSGVLIDVVSGAGDLFEARVQAKKLHPNAKFIEITELESHLQTLEETTAVVN